MKQSTFPPAKRLAYLGILAALTAALSLLESWLPPLPVPLCRLGLANITVTAAAWWFGPFGGAAMGVFKVGMALLLRGGTAAVMAACGTALSVTVTVLLLPPVRREVLSFVGVSVAAAGAHTVGQLCCAAWWLSPSVFGYAPFMMVTAVVSGVLTGLLFNMLAHRFSRNDIAKLNR